MKLRIASDRIVKHHKMYAVQKYDAAPYKNIYR